MDKSKREFGEGPVYTITNYIYWFLVSNIYFMLVNIPIISIIGVAFYIGLEKIPEGFYYIVFISSIPMGPAMAALLSVMGKLAREKSINATRDFFKAYKTNFIQSLITWTAEIIIMCILVFDVKFIRLKGYPENINTLIFVIMIFIFLLNIYIFPIISRFYLKTSDILKISAYYMVKKFNITILNVLSFVVVGFIFVKISTIIMLFGASIISYSLMFNEQKILSEIEDKIKED